MKTALVAGLAGLTLISISACSAPAPPSPTDSGTASDSDCIIGDWQLDVENLATQVEALLSAATPVDDLDVEGEQSLTFDADGTLSMRADLDATAEVDGRSLARALNATGTGEWEWVDEGSSLEVTGWSWEADPDSEAGDQTQLPTFDFADSPVVSVTCSDDSLQLEPDGAPVSGSFTRG